MGAPLYTDIEIRGVVYPDARAAAARFGVTPHAVWQAVARGREDRLGLPPQHAPTRTCPIRIGPLDFPSRRAAERALGLSYGTIRNARRRGSARTWQRILRAAMALHARAEREAA